MKNSRFKDQFTALLTELHDMEVLAREAAKSYLELTEQKARLDALNLNLENSDDEFIVFSGRVPCGRGCCSDYESISVPLNFIEDSEAYSIKYKAEQLAKEKRKEKEEELRKLKQAEQAKEKRKEQYEKLKKEFE